MSISHSVLVALLSFSFLWFLGIVLLCGTYSRDQLQDSRLLFFAPVVGLALISIVTTFLTWANLPSDLYAKPLGVALLLSALFVLAVQVRDFSVLRSQRNAWIAPATTLLIASILGLLPLILGGWQYAILRGNGADTFNYVAMANALKEYPMDWILGTSKQQLAEISPSLPLVQELINARWTTSAVLAFISSFTNISPLEFEYAYTVILFMVTSFALAAALVTVGLRQSLAAILSIAFCFGFWGQFILDLRAFSQIAAIPILVAIIGQLIARPTGPIASSPGILDWKVNTILIVAAIFQYPEMISAFLPCLFFLLLLRLYQGGRWAPPGREALVYCTRLVLGTGLLLAPLLGFLFAFTSGQARFAVQKSLGWEDAYFSWLKDPIRGIWGLSVSPGIWSPLDYGYVAAGVFTGIALSIIFVRRTFNLARYRNRPWFISEAGIAAMVAFAAAGAAYLVLIGNPWAAGKLVTYFSILIPIWFAIVLVEELPLPVPKSDMKQKLWRYLTLAAVASWALCNLAFAVARIVHAMEGSDYSDYIRHNGSYRRANADLFAQKPVSNCPHGAVVTVIDPRLYAREFQVHFLEGLGYKVEPSRCGQSPQRTVARKIDEPFSVHLCARWGGTLQFRRAGADFPVYYFRVVLH